MKSRSSGKLKKSLNLYTLTVYGVGTIIGSGIYSIISPATEIAGAAIWLSFILAAIAASFSAFSYAELATLFPSAGAEHNFLTKAFPKHPIAAFLVGLFIAIHGSATLAAVALTFGQYANKFLNYDIKFIAIFLLLGATTLNFSGLKKASWVNVSFTCIQIGGLMLITIAGFTSADFLEKVSESISQEINFSGVFAATSVLFFIFTGYEHMASLSEETENPEENIWKAFLLSLLVTTGIYLSIIFSLLALLGPDKLANSISPLADAGNLRHPLMGTVISIAALLATSNAVLSGSLSVSRLIFGMSRAGDLPEFLSKTSSTTSSPYFSILFVMFGSLIFLAIGEIKFAASLSSLGALIVFSGINFSVIVLRFTQPNLKRPFKIPGSIGGVPVIPVLGVLISLVLAAQYNFKVYTVFAIGTAFGILVYLFANKKVKSRTH